MGIWFSSGKIYRMAFLTMVKNLGAAVGAGRGKREAKAEA
jgi:hypothetical protein